MTTVAAISFPPAAASEGAATAAGSGAPHRGPILRSSEVEQVRRASGDVRGMHALPDRLRRLSSGTGGEPGVFSATAAGARRCGGKAATIVGTRRADVIRGTRKADVIVALGGNDRIRGGGGADTICAGAGGDVVSGGGGDDTVFGESGSDVLDGGGGLDILDGGAGDDVVKGGAGFDFAAAVSSPGGVTIDLGARTLTGYGRDRLASIEGAVGSGVADTLLAGPRGGVLVGLGGDDVLGGRGQGAIGYLAPVGVDLNRGVTRGAEGADRVSGVQAVVAVGDGRNTLIGSSRRELLIGGPRADVIRGGGGDDVLAGEGGADLLSGGPGDDVLVGGGGRDRLDGGPGTGDTVSYGRARRAVVVNLALGTGLGEGTDTLRGVESVTGSRYGDRLVGSALANRLAGGDGDDVLEGRGGSDALEGNDGNDVLRGGAGPDFLDGGAGRDRLSGGPGTDTCRDAARKRSCERSWDPVATTTLGQQAADIASDRPALPRRALSADRSGRGLAYPGPVTCKDGYGGLGPKIYLEPPVKMTPTYNTDGRQAQKVWWRAVIWFYANGSWWSAPQPWHHSLTRSGPQGSALDSYFFPGLGFFTGQAGGSSVLAWTDASTGRQSLFGFERDITRGVQYMVAHEYVWEENRHTTRGAASAWAVIKNDHLFTTGGIGYYDRCYA